MTKRLTDRIISLAAAFIMALTMLQVPALAAPSRIVRVGVNGGYGISVVGGEYSGFALDYLREIQKRTGCTYQFVSGTMPELAEKLAAGEVDIIPCVTPYEQTAWQEAAESAGYKGELVLSQLSLMVKFSAVYIKSDNNDLNYDELNELRKHRIGYLAEDYSVLFPNGDFITPDLRRSTFIGYNTESQMSTDLDSGKIDAVVKDCFRAWTNEMIVYQVNTSDCFFLAAEENADILAELDEHIAGIAMTDSRFSADLYEKYVSKYGTQRYAYSESEKYYVQNNPVIYVGFNMQSSLMDTYDSASRTLSGPVASMMKELSDISGLQIQLIPYKDLKECAAALNEGKVQAICGGVNAESMSAYSGIRFSAPYARIPIAAAGKSGSTVSARSRIAVPSGLNDISTYLADIYPGAQILRYEDERQCLNAVSKGEADVVFGGAYELLFTLGDDFDGFEIIDVRSSFHSECLAFPETSKDLAYIMGKSLACLSDNSSLINTYKAAAGSSGAAAANQFIENYLVWIIVGILAVLATVFAVVCITSFRSRRFADVDSLTGGKSKRKYFDDTRKLLKRTGAENWAIALFDIDKFKYVNDRLGYEEGNRMLERLHKTISDHLENDEVFSRLSDDNFAITMKNATDNELSARLNSIFNEFDRRNSLFVKYPVVFSAGICRLNQFLHENRHGEVDINSAIDRCKIAKSTLKGTHFSSIAFYDGSIRDRALREKDYENLMPSALARHEFECYLQPKYGLRSRNIEGAEALIRWNSKDFGFISPGDFIPIAEKNGFVVELDFFILEEVCRTMRRWIDDGKKPVVISVNQSRLHLNYDDYIWRLREIVDKYDIPYEYIELELTESVFAENAEKLLKVMHKLHEIGFKLSLDDFGSGYSSLNMLKDMPVDVVKIDKEFFSDTMNSQKGRAVITTVVDLAKNLDMDVISEGVETREQVEFLTEIHCAMVQGYYFAKPLPISEFEKLWFDDLEQIRKKKEEAAAQQQERLSAIERTKPHDAPAGAEPLPT